LLIVLITSFVGWAGTGNWGQVPVLKSEFVQAAQAMGGKPIYIILRHVLTATYIIISATLAVPSFIVGIGAESDWAEFSSLTPRGEICPWQRMLRFWCCNHG